MSYVLRIWENAADQPLPKTVDEAEARLAALRDVRTEQNPKFIRLAKHLVQKFPDPEEDESEESAWSDWPLDGETDNEPIWNLGVNTYRLDEVRPVVMQEANALGLCVMDEQAGEVYLPGNTVLCLPGKTPYVAANEQEEERVPKNKEFLDRIYQALEPMLAERGYKGRKRDRRFRRKFPEGWHELWIFAPAEYSTCALATISLSARFEPITGLRIAITDPNMRPESNASMFTMSGWVKQWIEDDAPFLSRDKEYKITKYCEIDIAIEHLCRVLREQVLPVLEACTTIEAYDRELNPPQGTTSFFRSSDGGFERILAAYLVRNPQLEELCRKHEKIPMWDPFPGGWVENPEVLACVDYVHTHPLPPLGEGNKDDLAG